jgi:uncharacterized protein YbjQ (UPF0145 family)
MPPLPFFKKSIKRKFLKYATSTIKMPTACVIFSANQTKGGADSMIITTTLGVEGKTITHYKGIVFGEVIMGTNFLKDVKASFTNVFGGRSKAYESDLIRARENALKELEERAAALGANAVVGVDVKYEGIGRSNDAMLMVSASGTAVSVE